ncbi:glutaredoxin family protein [Candidatus Poribacteria bacterium]|nr:glutaredoxin family protein [Candidatus Poribacteria bacterium]
MVKMTKVEGKRDVNDKVTLYALSTCIWCKKTKQLLDDLGIPYEFIYVNELSSQDKNEAIQEMGKYNPGGNFPTLVINDVKVIVGYKKEQIERELS